MSWMISADIAKLPEQKKTKTQEEPEKARDKLLIQLESRVRSLEYGQGSQVFLQKSHHLASNGAEIYQKYLEVVKQEGKDHKRGPPELQIFSGLLADFDPWLSDSSSPPEVRKFSGVGARLQAMLQNEDEVAASEWVKDFSFSPTFDSNVVRLSFTLKGQVLIARNMPQAQKLAQEQAAAWEKVKGGQEEFEEYLQRTPLEVPLKNGEYKLAELQYLVGVILRAWGASKKLGRAPRGGLAKGSGKNSPGRFGSCSALGFTATNFRPALYERQIAHSRPHKCDPQRCAVRECGFPLSVIYTQVAVNLGGCTCLRC
ncbi:unnamed protein product [Prorocentrum cordatum]|uniref:Uncharacterized protein n=1 Tax=Prorocentrum cordatum TaxID=2364126 RepID=A0ABN9VF46_9DINO|nr:unnamed protein product [Polarella glacialis]